MTEVRPGQLWRKSDHERITVQEVDGTTVTGALSDTTAHSTAAWAGSREDFAAYELLEDPNPPQVER